MTYDPAAFAAAILVSAVAAVAVLTTLLVADTYQAIRRRTRG